MCTTDGGTFAMGACPTNNRLAGTCVSRCGQPGESVYYLYDGSPSDTQTFCMSVAGTYSP
jgi:hypothetical protein